MLIAPFKSNLYEIDNSFFYISEEDRSRVPKDDLWRDLWTNANQYNEIIEKENDDWSIGGIIKVLSEPILPSPIVMFGWLDLLQKTDLPQNNIGWTIVSKHFLDIITSFGIKPKIYKIRVLDRSEFKNIYSENVRRYEKIDFSEVLKFYDEAFFGISLPKFQALSDQSDLLSYPKKIEWLSLNDRPPAFFLETKSLKFLVSQEGKDALEKAGLNGIRFTEPFQPF
jgi:hypothetical protein